MAAVFLCSKKEKNMEKQNTDNKFLGIEKVGKLLKMFSIPCVLSLIIQALYNLVDQIFIGNSNLGQLGNTATGIVYPLTVIALALGLFIGDGRVKPAEAKRIADAHFAAGNYDKNIEQVAKERKDEKELQAYARALSARIKAGENPRDVVNDMNNHERER